MSSQAMYVRTLALGPMKNFVYLVGAADASDVAVIDPAWDVPAILTVAFEDGKRVSCAIATHGHGDHINGLPELLAGGELPVYAQALEVEVTPALQEIGRALRPLEPGAFIEVGPLRLQALHAPGHTPGAQCLHCGDSLFTGDVLFVNGCGRCDFPRGSPTDMYRTLTRVLSGLPAETQVYPGHDYGDVPVSTLGRERERNPYLRFEDEASFVAYRMRPRT